MKYGNKIFNKKYLRLCTRNFSKIDDISLSHKVICNKLKLCYDIEKNPRPSFHDAEVYASRASSCSVYCRVRKSCYNRLSSLVVD